MDSERAETYLRLLAEAELRQARTAHEPGEFVVSGPHAVRHGPALRRVAQALVAVGAIDEVLADAIVAGFDLAIMVRQPNPQGRRPALTVAMHSSAVRRQLGRLVKAGTYQVTAPPARAPAQQAQQAPQAPDRVVPIGMMIPLKDDNVRGELYLLAYSQTASGARYSATAVLRGAPPLHLPDLVRKLTVTDDQGNAYGLTFSGGRSDANWAGLLALQPAPPPGIGWLELTAPGGVVRRTGLEPPAHPPAITVTETGGSPGEHLLHLTAVQILSTAAAPGIPGRGARMFTGPMGIHLGPELGETVDALHAAGALSPLSPVPGQLVTLCESLDIRDHGIDALPVRDLPKQWLSMLAYAHRRKRDVTTPRRGCAAVAVALPQLDGVTISVLGLSADETGTVLHVHARGIPAHLDPHAAFLPVFWLRDDDNRWHTAHISDWATGDDDEITAQLRVVPPLTHGTSVDLIAGGRSEQVRTTLPLDWR